MVVSDSQSRKERKLTFGTSLSGLEWREGSFVGGGERGLLIVRLLSPDHVARYRINFGSAQR
jgi:hypothetical protein